MKYDKKYWEYQSVVGKIGGFLNKFKFEAYISPHDTVLDFGCGGGYLLEQLDCKTKVGFEVNPHARKRASAVNIATTDNWEEIADDSVDVIISNHALEHVFSPMESLKQLHKKMKKAGRMVLVVPCEQRGQDGFTYNPHDQNQHVYTWCPQTLGNLVKASGFNIDACDTLHHVWTPRWETDYKNPDYHARCFEYSKQKGIFQVIVIATK